MRFLGVSSGKLVKSVGAVRLRGLDRSDRREAGSKDAARGFFFFGLSTVFRTTSLINPNSRKRS